MNCLGWLVQGVALLRSGAEGRGGGFSAIWTHHCLLLQGWEVDCATEQRDSGWQFSLGLDSSVCEEQLVQGPPPPERWAEARSRS